MPKSLWVIIAILFCVSLMLFSTLAPQCPQPSPYADAEFQGIGLEDVPYAEADISGTNDPDAVGFATLTRRNFGGTGIEISVSNLPPGPHAWHIHAGSCQAQGAIVYHLSHLVGDLVADSDGNAQAMVLIDSDVPMTGYYINIHQESSDNGDGPGIACGNIGAAAFRFGRADLTPTGDPDARGVASFFETTSNETRIEISVSNLPPGAHAWHIHSGSCQAQGAILIDLSNLVGDLVADENGNAQTRVMISNNISTTGTYINIHANPSSSGSGPGISCGNIREDHAPYGKADVMGTAIPTAGGSATFMELSNGDTQLTVKLSNVPAGGHAWHIHQGSCQAQGQIVIDLSALVGDLVADSNGDVDTTVVVDGLIATSGFYLNVHELPASQGSGPGITCGNIVNADDDPGLEPAGTATFTAPRSGGTQISVSLTNLPTGLHGWHIHEGSCENQGPVVYNLSGDVGDLEADSNGKVEITVTIADEIPAQGFYLNIHEHPSADGYGAGLACGNILPIE